MAVFTCMRSSLDAVVAYTTCLALSVVTTTALSVVVAAALSCSSRTLTLTLILTPSPAPIPSRSPNLVNQMTDGGESPMNSDSVGSESTKSKCFKKTKTTTVAVREASPEVDLAETEDSYGENVLEFDASRLGFPRSFLGDLRSFRLFVVSPPMTDDLWKIFYEQHFGVESANTEINRMKQKKVVFKWRLLYEVLHHFTKICCYYK
ncbi:hypothetical protein B296_00017277 [Ensete ventricosum]|uniref:Uncharacterized protein n=1 Tax=Ensete ventricosum TaxID=4639 RepID=A0A426Y5F1_ENSVE|nr:hypothetical protein B296_00017277 [Ensete ventricosum]